MNNIIREIKFRAKKVLSFHDYGLITTGELVYGSLVDLDKDNNYIYIIPKHTGASTLCPIDLMKMSAILVDKNTICQFTGLKDKNGRDVYEGDIVKIDIDDEELIGVIKFGRKEYTLTISNNQEFYIDFASRNIEGGIYFWIRNYGIEVIGNIYENEDLLK